VAARTRNPDELVDLARGGDRSALARLLSLVEQGGDSARAVGRRTHQLGGSAYTVGITGAPGAGKSTLTNAMVSTLRAGGDRVGVLAIDPSSPFTGGAILGDRVRMGDHVLDEGVFIRSMATRGHLGGLALAAPEAVRVLDAAGYPWVILETVGVGQVEVEVVGTADTTVVVVNPGWGDSVQANKAGLMEIADVFVINKADRPGADSTRRDLEQMLDLSVHDHDDLGGHDVGGHDVSGHDGSGHDVSAPDAGKQASWRPPVVSTVASTGAGVDELVAAITAHRTHLETGDGLERRRHRRLDDELHRIIAERLRQRARALGQGEAFDRARELVVTRKLDPWSATDALLGPDAP
jgi:LAO/AO transport system kinase